MRTFCFTNICVPHIQNLLILFIQPELNLVSSLVKEIYVSTAIYIYHAKFCCMLSEKMFSMLQGRKAPVILISFIIYFRDFYPDSKNSVKYPLNTSLHNALVVGIPT